MAEPSTEESEEIKKLRTQDAEMRTIMGMMGAIVDIIATGKETDNMVKAAHCVMNSAISIITNNYKWSKERRRLVYESMKSQEPFSKALDALGNEPDPEPEQRRLLA